MKKYKIQILIILTLFLVLLTAGPAAARATRIDYEASECPIVPWGEPERSWVSEDGVIHMRGFLVQNLIVSESPYLAGINQINANMDLNPATGEGHAYGSVLITPFVKNGTWEGRFSTHVSPDGIQGKAVVHGTGELSGMKQYNNISNSDPNDPCHSHAGYVLIP
jgi:hypothetical protein